MADDIMVSGSGLDFCSALTAFNGAVSAEGQDLEGAGKTAPMRALGIVASVVAATGALSLGYLAAGDLYLTGFPDGHLTDYDIAADAPKRILMWTEFGFVPLFLVLAFSPIGARKRAIGLLAALIVLSLTVLVQLVGVPWYFGTHLGLDNGIGG